MPGRRLLSIASAWFDEATVARVFEPLIADWQQEQVRLTGVARARSALGGYVCFATTFVLSLPWQLKAALPERVVLSGWIATEAFAAAAVVAQIYLFYDLGAPGASYLIPAMLGTALPLAIVPAAVIVSRLGDPVEMRTMVLRLALMLVVVLAPLLAWINPVTNQSWRERQRPPHEIVLRGSRELTLPDLLSSQPPIDLVDKHAREWHKTREQTLLERGSVLLMPLTMALLGLAIAGLSRRWWWLTAIVGWLAAAAIWLTLLAAIPWSTHAILLALAMAVHWTAGRRTPQPSPVA